MKKHILMCAVFLGMCAVAVPAHAQQAQSSAVFYTDLSVGSRGQDVVNLQTWLETNGYLVMPPGVGKGYFGPSTQAALIRYQSAAGIIPTTGFFGPLTRARINASGNVNNGNNNGNANGGVVIPYPSQNSSTVVINGIDAPTALNVGQTGTWTVRATDSRSGTLSYSVNWGDSLALAPSNTSSQSVAQYAQATSFSHSYAAAGTYTIRFTVSNGYGMTAQTTSTVQVGQSGGQGGGQTAGPLHILVPNGGEVWQRGSSQTIAWTSPYYFVPTYATINLLRYMPPCPPNQACPMIAYAPYTIASNISINQNAYTWRVGDAATYLNNTTIPDGQYTIQICDAKSNVCDASDAPFTISSTQQTSNLPDINIVSPNGGEVWQTGMNQMVTANVTGDASRVGGIVSVSLLGYNNQTIPLTTSSTGFGVGVRAVSFTLPTTVAAGQYRILVNLYSQGSLTQQAYDYSDNYITIINGQNYGYPSYPSVCSGGRGSGCSTQGY